MKRLMTRIGTAGTAGVTLLALGFAFLAFVLSPREARLAALRAEAERAAASRAESNRPALPHAKLASFYGFFEREPTVTDYLAQLYSLAQQAGIEPRMADYRFAEPKRLRLAEYSVRMPLRGSYGQIRTFLENALGEISVLTLDQISVRRNRAADPFVEAEVRFTLFLPQP